MLRSRVLISIGLFAFCVVPCLCAQSFYPVRLEDRHAVYLSAEKFGAKGDGVADDTAALQKAIDTVADTTRQGILFVPEGSYRLTHTLYVWPGVRIIGYGARRPALVLGANTPGYQTGPSYMVLFTGGRTGESRGGGVQRPRNAPAVPFAGTVPPAIGVVDANPGTFYSAMSNIDFEIADGNAGAVGIRFHVAQHCFLTHMDFHIGSGMAALQDIGNEGEDLHFHGGQYGIMTGRPSPGWQYTLLDSSFEGQREAAIREHEAGLALVHDSFKDVPTAIDIEPNHIEELWIKDTRFENISKAAIVISSEDSRLTEINVEGALCHSVNVFAQLRDSGKMFSGSGKTYRVANFTHGLTFDSPQAVGSIRTQIHTESLSSLPEDRSPVIHGLPSHSGWANALELGAKGDGKTDDTAALQRAVDTHDVVYLPSGRYLLTDTLRLRPATVLIGLHPSTTQLDLADSTPGFDGVGGPKPMLLAPSGGSTIVTGIGIYPGGVNSRAVGAMWMAGKESLMDDVRFLGGHGTNNPDGSRVNPYNNTHSGDPNALYRWDAQYPSLWVLNGGGTFADIWTPDTFSQAGLYVSETTTEGHVYELSSEHHVRNEVKLKHVSNWEIVSLQTEEERGEGPQCLPLAIDDSENITIAEMHAYRVVSSFVPFPETIHVANSHNIRFRNLHIYSDSKAAFDSSVSDEDIHLANRELEIAALTIPGAGVTAAPAISAHPTATRIAGGFFNASSATVDSHGSLYFIDSVKQNIYRYVPAEKRLELVRDNPIDAGNIFLDRSDNLMVVSYGGAGTVYALKPGGSAENLQVLRPQPATPRPDSAAVLPVDYWRFESQRDTDPKAKPWQYVSPDGSTFLPAGDDFVKGILYYGVKMADVLRAFSLGRPRPGSRFYITDEGQKTTYSAQVGPDGSLSDVKFFANRGGESAAVGPDGNIYIAAGQIYVYRPDGRQVGEIDVPERPTSIAFGDEKGSTLFILARTSLYSAQPLGREAAGRRK